MKKWACFGIVLSGIGLVVFFGSLFIDEMNYGDRLRAQMYRESIGSVSHSENVEELLEDTLKAAQILRRRVWIASITILFFLCLLLYKLSDFSEQINSISFFKCEACGAFCNSRFAEKIKSGQLLCNKCIKTMKKTVKNSNSKDEIKIF